MIFYSLEICMLVNLFILFCLDVIHTCPSSCECTSKYVNCTLRNKDKIPSSYELDRLVETLDLSWNNITSLPDQVFLETRITDLKVIHLNKNNIKYISENAFLGQKYLEYVDLSFNNISHISLGVFNWSNNIAWLSLAHNPLVVFNPVITNLKYIDLSHCNLPKIPNIKAPSVNLENNNITKVGKVQFDYIDQLENLKLSHNPFICDCDLQDFMDVLEAHNICPNNECSNSGDVTYNMRSRNCTVCPIGCQCNYWGMADCINSNLEQIPGKGFNTSVTTILLSKNKISTVKNYTFSELNTTNLQYLSLNYNRILFIESLAFSGLSQLEYLDLSFNRLTNLYDISFIQMRALSRLSIAGNTLSSISIASETNVSYLDLSNCGLRNFTEVAEYWGHSLTWLSLKGNKIYFLFAEDLEIMSSMVSIDISGNPLECYVNLTDSYLWLKRKRLAENTTCSLPLELNNKYWQVLEMYWLNHTTTEIASSSTSVIILAVTTCIFFASSLFLGHHILRNWHSNQNPRQPSLIYNNQDL